MEKVPSDLPFQFQFGFSDKGAKYLRVVSVLQPTTKKREVAEEQMDVAMCAIAGVQRIAALVEEGDVAYASLQFRALHEMVQRCSKTDCQCEEIGEFVEKTKELDTEMRSFVVTHNLNVKASSSSSKKKGSSSSSSHEKKKGKEKKVGEMTDQMAETVHKAKAANKALLPLWE